MHILKILVIALFSVIGVSSAQAEEVTQPKPTTSAREVMDKLEELYDQAKSSCKDDRERWTDEHKGGSIEVGTIPSCDAFIEIEQDYWLSVTNYKNAVLNGQE